MVVPFEILSTNDADILTEFVCPFLGSVVATVMFLAPIRDLRSALQKGKGLGELNSLPWIFMTGNCIGWTGYSFVVHDYFILLSNGPGIFISLWLNFGAAKLQHLEHEKKRLSSAPFEETNNMDSIPDNNIENNNKNNQVKVWTFNEKYLILILTVWLIIFASLSFLQESQTVKADVIGILVNCNLVIFLSSPLSSIVKVIRTKNSISIHIPTCILCILNSSFWVAYGIAIFDPFVIVPNLLGLIMGIIQAALICLYPPSDSSVIEIEGCVDTTPLIEGGVC